jgi:hypothetical protein
MPTSRKAKQIKSKSKIKVKIKIKSERGNRSRSKRISKSKNKSISRSRSRSRSRNRSIAATKMQSIFRGNKTRKRMKISPSSKETCVICLEEMDKLYNISNLSCKNKHPFHNKCLNEWINHGNESCPTCRQDIEFSDYQKASIIIDKHVMDKEILSIFKIELKKFQRLLVSYNKLYKLKNKNIPEPILHLVKDDEKLGKLIDVIVQTRDFANKLYNLKDDKKLLRNFIRANGYREFIIFISNSKAYIMTITKIVSKLGREINFNYKASEMGLMVPNYLNSNSKGRKIDYIAQRFSNLVENAKIPLSY